MTLGNIAKGLAPCFIIVAFLFGGFFGAFHLGMNSSDSQMGGQMGPCPLMPGVAICNMTPLQHVSAAQSMFNGLPTRVDVSAIVLAFLAMSIGLLPFLRQSLFPQAPAPLNPVSVREYVPTHHALQELFARGILNPKIF